MSAPPTPHPTPASGAQAALVTRLRRLDTESVSDALDSLGHEGCLLAGVRPLWPTRRIAGRVVPVRLVPHDPVGPAPTSHLGTRAVDASGGDDVIIVDNAARENVAGWGGLLSRAASIRGVAGVVVYGAVRDVAEAEVLDFPVYGTATVPRTARGRVVEATPAGTLELGDSLVTESDFVIADASGVLVIPAAVVAEVLDRAERIHMREQAMAHALDAGMAVSEVMAGNYEQMLGRLGSPQ